MNTEQDLELAPFAILVEGGFEIRQALKVPQEHRDWDGHTCQHGLRSRHGGYAAVSVEVTGRKVRFTGRDWRVTCRLQFATGDAADGPVSGELVFADYVEMSEVLAAVST